MASTRDHEENGSAPDAAPDFLAACCRRGPERARERIISAHRPLVEGIADRFARVGVMREDLVQEGTIGLIRAIDNFEPGRNVPLRVYAARMIAGHIQHFLRDRAAMVRRRRTDASGFPEVISLEGLAASEEKRDAEPLNEERALLTDGGLGEGFLLRQALDCLSRMQREALEMRFLERLGIEEIAAELGMEAPAAQVCIEHACSRLARALELGTPVHPSDAEFDPVSGVLSWPAFRRRAREELAGAALEAEAFSVALLQLSDSAAVDPRAERRVLRGVGGLLHSNIRRTDVAGRFEGRSFALALPHTDLAGCDAMLARVLDSVRRMAPPLVPRAAAAASPADGFELEELLAVAAARLEPSLARAA